MAMTSVRMPDELMGRLEKAAENLRRSKGWLINDALGEYLAREEAKVKLQEETQQALADVEAGRLVDGDEVIEWVESWGAQDEKEPPTP
ncbi:MAG: transcriptional regulator [Moraxellaceae bacterium]|nr:MAG: transcriptional regulator [Moraxellaceae bacterium]